MSERSLEYALAKAVSRRDLEVVKGTDGGALYCLTSYAEAYPAFIDSVRQMPLRTLERQNATFDSKAVRRWIHADGLRGAHDYRPGHKCIPCGNRKCLFLDLQNPTKEEFMRVMCQLRDLARPVAQTTTKGSRTALKVTRKAPKGMVPPAPGARSFRAKLSSKKHPTQPT
jgi:hypothetical protein